MQGYNDAIFDVFDVKYVHLEQDKAAHILVIGVLEYTYRTWVKTIYDENQSIL